MAGPPKRLSVKQQGKYSTDKGKDTEGKGSKDTLQFKTWILKVPIHCPACARKVKKVLQGTEGVLKTEVNPNDQKVTVTGNVKPEILIKELNRHGKHGEVLPEEPKKVKDGEKKVKHRNPKGEPIEKEDEDDDFDDFHLADDYDSDEDSEPLEEKLKRNVKIKKEGNSTGGGMVPLWSRGWNPSAPISYNNQTQVKQQPRPMYPPQPHPFHLVEPMSFYRPPLSVAPYGASYYSSAFPKTVDTSYLHYPLYYDHGAMDDDFVTRCSIL